MKKISNPTLISFFTKLLILLVIAKGISLFLLFYLPNESVELSVKNNYQPKYQRVDFKNMISKAKTNQKEESVKAPQANIENMVLKGLYGIRERGFVIVAMKSNIKTTTIVGVEEYFEGYRLKSISQSSAIFEKNGTNFILNLEDIKEGGSVEKVENDNKEEEAISVNSNGVIMREDISHYTKNIKEVWKDVSVTEVKDGENIKGFRLNIINQNSKFATLGLQSGDVIIKANNIALSSYKDALDIYSNIDKFDTLQIVVMRNNKEMELIYEIN